MAGRCCEGRPPARLADAIVVLGCRGSALARRVDRAIQLYREGAAPLLVLSGGGTGPVPEAEYMRRIAIAGGIPEEALLLDAVSHNTIENARETARLMAARGLRSVLLVSDRTHLPRARLLFALARLNVVACAVAPPPSVATEARAAIYELTALPMSLLRSLFAMRRRRSLRQ
jgi:uncharacterized SAM-binding protein YcdF (DUF218 family)